MTLLELLGLPRLTCPYSSIRTCPYLHGPDSHAHECGAVESRGCVSPNPSLLITSHMRCARIPWSLTSGQPQAHTKYMHCQGLQKVGDSFTDFALPGKHSPSCYDSQQGPAFCITGGEDAQICLWSLNPNTPRTQGAGSLTRKGLALDGGEGEGQRRAHRRGGARGKGGKGEGPGPVTDKGSDKGPPKRMSPY
eukprot:1159254-Pelagomonas_calceolata.AAC.7